MERKHIEKRYIKRDSLMSFTLVGDELCENINYDELDHLLDATFQNMKSYEDMPRNVSWIRTILKNLEEKNLIILVNSIENHIRTYFLIHYKNNRLNHFEYTQSIRYAKNPSDEFSAEYNADAGIKFHIPTLDSIEEYEKSKDLVNNVIEQVKKLDNPVAVTLDYDSKLLCEIYKTFYQENPDFSNENIQLKVQTMMCILEEFGITLEKYSGFSIYSYANFPISFNLKYLVDRLTPLGEVNVIEDPIKLAEEAKNTIKIVGEIINETTLGIPGKLAKISLILHARTYNLSSRTSYQEMAEYTNCSPKEVESSIQLVKKIEDTLRK